MNRKLYKEKICKTDRNEILQVGPID